MVDSKPIRSKAERQQAVGKEDFNDPIIKYMTDEAEKLFEPKRIHDSGDWLVSHKEKGQTYGMYQGSQYVNYVSPKKNTIYLFLLDNDISKDRIDTLVTYTKAFYTSMEVKLLRPGDEINGKGKKIPKNFIEHYNVKTRDGTGYGRQINTISFLNVLKTLVPNDAYCVQCVTNQDLYPGPNWNFVYGWAYFQARVGVFSFKRYENDDEDEYYDEEDESEEEEEKEAEISPVVALQQAILNGDEAAKDPQAFLLKLMKQLKNKGKKKKPATEGDSIAWKRRACHVIVHEIGHMFGIWHCVFYECTMNGFNSAYEQDRYPDRQLCPVCIKKLRCNIKFDTTKRFENLLKVSKDFGFKEEIDFYTKCLKESKQKYPNMKPSAYNGAGNATKATPARGGNNLTVGTLQNVNKRSSSQNFRGNSNVRTTTTNSANSKGKVSNISKNSTASGSSVAKASPIIKKTIPSNAPKAKTSFAVAKVSLNNLALNYNNK